MGTCVDCDGGSPHALQPDRLPHEQHFIVGSRTHDDEVARCGIVDRGLDRVVRGILPIDVGWGFAADGDGYRVDGLLAVGGSDGQLAALGSGRHAALLHGASRLPRRQARHLPGDSCVAPGNVGHRNTADGYVGAVSGGRTCGGSRTEAIVARDEFLVERTGGRLRPGIGMVEHFLVAQRRDSQRMSRAGCAHPRPFTARVENSACRVVADHAGDGRSSIRVRAVNRVVTIREGRGGHHWRVHVLRLPRHKWDLVAELAVSRVV